MKVVAFAGLSLLAWPAIAAGPVFDHWPPQLADGKDLVIKTGIRTTTSVYRPTLHWRKLGTVPFTEVPLKTAGAGLFQATIPAAQIGGADVEYYLQAFDESDVETTRSRWPVGREYEQLRVRRAPI